VKTKDNYGNKKGDAFSIDIPIRKVKQSVNGVIYN